MSEFLRQMGCNYIVDEGFSQKKQTQSVIVEKITESIEVPVPQSVPVDTPKIKVSYQFLKKKNNIPQPIQIPEVRNYRDQNFYFFGVLLQLCHEIEEQLKCKYKICHIQILDENKLEIGKMNLSINSKQDVIAAHEQNIQLNVQLNKFTLNTIELNQLMKLQLFQVLEFRDMQNYLISKEVTFNFQIELYQLD